MDDGFGPGRAADQIERQLRLGEFEIVQGLAKIAMESRFNPAGSIEQAGMRAKDAEPLIAQCVAETEVVDLHAVGIAEPGVVRARLLEQAGDTVGIARVLNCRRVGKPGALAAEG